MNLISKELNAGKLIMRLGLARKLNGLQDYHSRSIQDLPENVMSSNVMLSTFAPQVKQEKVALLELLPSFIASIVRNPKISYVPEASSWLQQLLDYTLIGGKSIRGINTVYAYEAVEKPEKLTQEALSMARTLGWCVELLQAYFLIADDILDGSSTRRGKPCWHTQPGVGESALKDILMMQGSLFEILRVNFKEHPHYADMLDLFNEAILYTSIGEHLDYIMSKRNKSDYRLFTTQQYSSIVKHKAAYYTFKLPILLGYLLANNSNGNLHRMLEEMCFDLGLLYQIQNDVMDNFGEESVTGKNGTDIQEGKCSWLAVHALKHSNDAQRAFFIENYADKDPAKVQNIKNLYEELKLQELYRKEAMFLCESIKEKASMLPINDRKLLLKILNTVRCCDAV